MPYSHSNLRGEWDARQIVGLADGDAVATWPDVAPNNGGVSVPDMVQATGGNKPLYKTNIRNGLPVVRFDTNDFMSSHPRDGSALTMAIVLKLTSGNTGASQVPMYNGTSTTGGGAIVNSSGNRAAYVRGKSVDADSSATTNWERWIVCLGNAGGSGSTRMYVDSTQVVSTTTSMNAVVPGTNILAIGREDTGINTGGMDVAHALIFNASLTATEVGDLDRYLASIWGTPMKTPIQRRPMRGLIIR